MDCRPGFVPLASSSVVGGLQPGNERQAPHPVLRRRRSLVGQLIAEEAIPQRRIVSMDLPQHIDQMRVVPVSLRHGVTQPLVIPLSRSAQHPARHRDRHPDRGPGRGHFTDEREDYFPGRFACDK